MAPRRPPLGMSPAPGSVTAQLEGQVLFAKLYNDTQRLDTLWTDCLALLGARRPAAAAERRST